MNIGICRLSLLYESTWFGSYYKVVLNHGLKENQKGNNQHTHLSGNFIDLANHFSCSKCFKVVLRPKTTTKIIVFFFGFQNYVN